MRAAFITRGHGFGHAARDLKIISALRARNPDLAVDLMSSGSGLAYYRDREVPCADLGIADGEDLTEAARWAVWRRLAKTPSPWDLIVTDEVVPAIAFGHHVLRVPVVALTDWFFADFGKPRLDRLFDPAAEVIVLDFEQSHPQPPDTSAAVHHAGPVVQDFALGRDAARKTVGVRDGVFTAVLTLGGMPNRPEAVRLLTAVIRGWRGHAGPESRLFVLGDVEHGTRESFGAGPESVVWVGASTEPEVYYAAADVVLVDAMGFTGCELAFNRRRVIALTDAEALSTFPASFRRRVDYMSRRGWLETADAAGGAEQLWELISRPAAHRHGRNLMPSADLDGLARRILGHVEGRAHERG